HAAPSGYSARIGPAPEVPRAIVATESWRDTMQRQGDVAVGTFGHETTLRTLQKGCIAPAVEQQDRLLAAIEDAVQRTVERLRPGDRVTGANQRLGPEIE